MRYRYRKEEEMKDSGVEWIGKIPKEWGVCSIRYLFNLIGGGTPDSSKSEYWNGDVIWITPKDINNTPVVRNSERQITQLGLANSSAKKIPPNSLIVTTRAPIGNVAINTVEATTNQGCHSLIRKDNQDNKYYYYYLLVANEELNSNGSGTTFKEISRTVFGNIKTLKIKLNEEIKIARFLDEKTAQFDSIISKKEALIERLEEAKKSLISEVVTGKVKVVKTEDGYELVEREKEEMKDSGVEWLGLVPKEWKVKKIKHVLAQPLKYGANESAELDDRNLPRYIRITDFGENGELKDETFKSLPFEKAKEYYLQEGDILFARSGATVGKTFLFEKYDGKACFAGYLIKATTDENKVNPKFLYRFTKSKNYDNWKNSIFMQATIQNIGADKYKELKFVLPSIGEQNIICDYIDNEDIHYNGLINRVRIQIDKLKQAKQSLISEAVTGKIEILD